MPRHRPIAARLLAAGLVGAWLLTAVPTVLAADPPADVVLDGQVTVTFTLDGQPVADAAIEVGAFRPETGDEPFQVTTGTTDTAGIAVITGVARPADGAPPVTLQVSGHRSDPNECGGEVTIDGAAETTAAAAVEVTLLGGATSSCIAIPITGTVVTSDGDPVVITDAFAIVTYPDGSIDRPSIVVGAGGSISIVVEGWTVDGTTVVELTVFGEERIVHVDGAPCDERVVDEAVATWELTTPEAVEPRTIVAEPTVVGEVCGSQGTPAPAAPDPTLPPTDAGPGIATADRQDAGPAATAAALAVLALLLAASLGLVGRVSRRGS